MMTTISPFNFLITKYFKQIEKLRMNTCEYLCKLRQTKASNLFEEVYIKSERLIWNMVIDLYKPTSSQ